MKCLSFRLRRLRTQLLGLAICVVLAPTVAAEGSLILTTENYLPFNMQDEATLCIVRISTDILRAMMSRAGQSYQISFFIW